MPPAGAGNATPYAVTPLRPRLWCLLLALVCYGATTQAATNKPINAAQLQQVIEEHLLQAVQQRWPGATTDVSLLLPSAGAKLANCTDLSIKPRSQRLVGRVPVAVRCLAPTPWQIFLQAELQVALPVVVTRTAIARKQTLQATDLQTSLRNLSGLRRQFLTDIKQASGTRVNRAMAAGEVLYHNALTVPATILKGQQVAIASNRGSIRIGAKGRALQAGMRGDQIKVRNLQSGREVHAWVVGPGQVSSSWPDPES